MKPTLNEATIAHTQLGAAWLWASRECRVIADEVGFGCSEACSAIFSPPARSGWRADLVGVRWHTPQRSYRYGEGHALIDLIEVKGHRADWRREKPLDVRSKWQEGQHSTVRLWLLVSATIDDALLADLPPWWGILRADPAVENLTVVRKAPQTGRIEHVGTAEYSMHSIAQRSVTSRLPTMSYARDERGALHQGTVTAALLALRKPGPHWLGQPERMFIQEPRYHPVD